MEGCTAFGKVYHKECFKCSSCRRKIDGKFFERSDKPYCDKCYAKITEICVECKQPIKGDCIEAGKNFYHPRCMRCFVCNDVLMGQFLIYEDKPICERDYKVIFRENPAVIFWNQNKHYRFMKKCTFWNWHFFSRQNALRTKLKTTIAIWRKKSTFWNWNFFVKMLYVQNKKIIAFLRKKLTFSIWQFYSSKCFTY